MWEKTVMSVDEIETLLENRFDSILTECLHRVAKAQAEITGEIAYKEGIKKVVEWVEDNSLACQSNTPCNKDRYQGFHTQLWQAFKKENGL